MQHSRYRWSKGRNVWTSGRWARYLNALLGGWLFISAFVWARGPVELSNTWVTGMLILIAALSAAWVSAVRWGNAVLGAWLVVSSVVLAHRSNIAFWHDVALGIAVFALSLVPSRTVLGTRWEHEGASPHSA